MILAVPLHPLSVTHNIASNCSDRVIFFPGKLVRLAPRVVGTRIVYVTPKVHHNALL
jgi:hypothetical protein